MFFEFLWLYFYLDMCREYRSKAIIIFIILGIYGKVMGLVYVSFIGNFEK